MILIILMVTLMTLLENIPTLLVITAKKAKEKVSPLYTDKTQAQHPIVGADLHTV